MQSHEEHERLRQRIDTFGKLPQDNWREYVDLVNRWAPDEMRRFGLEPSRPSTTAGMEMEKIGEL